MASAALAFCSLAFLPAQLWLALFCALYYYMLDICSLDFARSPLLLTRFFRPRFARF
jgi:hypothetical protein